jgi:hypothetical protein
MDSEKETDEIVEQVKKRRRSKNANGAPTFGDNGVLIEPSENAAICAYALDIFHVPAVDLENPKAVENAIDGYFKNCIDRGLRPGNLGLYATLGLSKQDVSNAIHGYSRKLSPEVIDLLKKAKVALSAYREMLGSTGKINPVTLIFWQKNYDGLEDKQTMEVAPRRDLQPDQTPDEIAKRLEQDIPIDVDCEEP